MKYHFSRKIGEETFTVEGAASMREAVVALDKAIEEYNRDLKKKNGESPKDKCPMCKLFTLSDGICSNCGHEEIEKEEEDDDYDDEMEIDDDENDDIID